MVLGAAFDSNVMSYPMLIFMKVQGVLVGRGGARPRTSGGAEPALRRRARRNQASVVRARSVVAFLSDRKRQRSMIISSISLGTRY